MKRRPRLLDAYCGAGGASVGYDRAGFDVVGVDIRPQPRYPFELVQMDAIEAILTMGKDFDAIAASPPCQRYSNLTPKKSRGNHPDLIAKTRAALEATGKPWVIENVVGARSLLNSPLMLCGSMFGLRSRRHRLFESSFFILCDQRCDHRERPLLVTTAGANSRAIRSPGQYKSVKNALAAYGIDWMDAEGLKEAIPPAFTTFIGHQLLRIVEQS